MTVGENGLVRTARAAGASLAVRSQAEPGGRVGERGDINGSFQKQWIRRPGAVQTDDNG